MNIPDDLKYTKDHEWLRIEGDQAGIAVIGISEHAAEQLGDIVFVELPEAGTEISQGESFGSVESVKAVSDLFAPISGTVTETNSVLMDQPELVNEDPYGKAWMVKVKLADTNQPEGLLSGADYKAHLDNNT